jgi:hypothetical protein
VKADCEREAGRKESGEEGEKFSVIPLSNRKKEGKREKMEESDWQQSSRHIFRPGTIFVLAFATKLWHLRICFLIGS